MYSTDSGRVNRRAFIKRSSWVVAALAASMFTGPAMAADGKTLEARIAVLEEQIQALNVQRESVGRQADQDRNRSSNQFAQRRTFWEEYWSRRALDRN